MTDFNKGVGRYIDLMFDRGFKRVFGKESNKDILIAFLNETIPDRRIEDLQYINNENEGMSAENKKSYFDVQCTTSDGTTIIVEVQRSNQAYFRERVLYYASLPILRQVEKGGAYRLLPVYVISILDFALEHEAWERGRIESHYSIREVHTGEEMTDALQFIFIELGRFEKRIDELENDKEKLYFCLLNMGRFLERPKEMQAEMFRRLFDVSEVEGLPSKEREQYIKDMAIERDIINQKEYARQEGKLEGIAEGEARGRLEGLAEGRSEIVRAMLARGMDAGTVAEITGLEEAQIKSL